MSSSSQLTPIQHPFFTPVLHAAAVPMPVGLPMLPPAISIDDLREAPPTPQIRPKLPGMEVESEALIFTLGSRIWGGIDADVVLRHEVMAR